MTMIEPLHEQEEARLMYMGGRGVMEQTECLNAEMDRLVDAMWDSLGLAFIGLSTALIGPLLSWAVILDGSLGEPTATWHLIAAITIAAVSLSGGVWLSLPWFRAERALKRQIKIVKAHAAAMKRETALRGESWAQS